MGLDIDDYHIKDAKHISSLKSAPLYSFTYHNLTEIPSSQEGKRIKKQSRR